MTGSSAAAVMLALAGLAATPTARADGRRSPRYMFALEAGYADAATDSDFASGSGKHVVFGLYGFEARLWEFYDLDDATDRLDGVAGADARLMISSVGRRFSLLGRGRVRGSLLAGLAWLRRESTRGGPLDLQEGFGAQLGAGVTYRRGTPFVAVEVRGYPTLWAGEEGGTPFTITVAVGATR